MNNFEKSLQMLIEMPLPKDMEPNALDSKAGKYSKAQPEKELEKHGTKVGKGSSRVAYRVHVEPEQFEDNGHHELPMINGKVDTVIKLALNPKGIAQNHQELLTYEQYSHNGFLLPIIDSSYEHKSKIVVNNDPHDTYSNWIQMPFVETTKSKKTFDQYFTKYFGDLIGFFTSKQRSPYTQFNFEILGQHRAADTLFRIRETDDRQLQRYFTNQQLDNINSLLELVDAGLELGDLGRTANWGIYKGKPVIIDYGFDSETKGLYSGAIKAEAFVDRKGYIRLNTVRQAPRNRW